MHPYQQSGLVTWMEIDEEHEDLGAMDHPFAWKTGPRYSQQEVRFFHDILLNVQGSLSSAKIQANTPQTRDIVRLSKY